jgi:hypothetical protein
MPHLSRAASPGRMMVCRMWHAAGVARVRYLWHRARGHSVIWRTEPSDLPRCMGDIVCETCAEVLWCRAYDPWAVGTLAERDVRDEDDDETSTNREAATLFQSLDHVLRLAEALPRDASGDCVRRSVCELIEANSGQEQRDRLLRLVDIVHDLERRDAHRRNGVDDSDSSGLKQLLRVVRREILPILERPLG